MSKNNPSIMPILPRNRKDIQDHFLVFFAIALVVIGQVVLVYSKAINWDEFLHYGMVYDLERGRAISDFNTVYTRLFAWVPGTGRDIIDEITVARLVMLGFELLAMSMVILLAHRFTDKVSAMLAGLLYIAGGYTFLHGFSFRPDPMVAGLLMTALYLLALGRLDALRILAIGALIGLAGLANIKAIFYLPCFAGIALKLLGDSGDGRIKTLLKILAIPVVSIVTFLILYGLHKSGIAVGKQASMSLIDHVASYIGGTEPPRFQYSIVQFLLTPLITIGIAILPIAMKCKSRDEKIVLIGLVLPLITLLFYRNTFPYYFAFILPPVCAATAVSLGYLSKRYSARVLIVIMLITPVFLAAKMDRDTIGNQRFLVGQIHELFPEPTGYLAYTSYVSDYPRVISHLISGVRLKRYYAMGDPVISQAIERGDVGFVLADNPFIEAGLSGGTLPVSLLPEDFAALHANFLQFKGPLWVYGKKVCGQAGEQQVMLHRSGAYTIDGNNAVIDGQLVTDGSTVALPRGTHTVLIQPGACVHLWGGQRPPKSNLAWPKGPYGDRF